MVVEERIVKDTRYQKHLLVIASAVKTVLMFLFGCIFIIAPTPDAFRLLRLNGVSISPTLIAILIFSFIACYPTLLAKSNWTVERRHQFFLFGSLPVYVYFFALVYINFFIMHRISLGTVSYFAICLLFLILPSAIFYGYRRSLEILACAAMSFLMILSALATAFTQNAMIFSVANANFHINLVPITMAMLFAISGIGYFCLIFLRNLPSKFKPMLFGVFATPVGIYGLLLVYNALKASLVSSLILPLVTVDLSIIILLIGFALYQPTVIIKGDRDGALA